MSSGPSKWPRPSFAQQGVEARIVVRARVEDAHGRVGLVIGHEDRSLRCQQVVERAEHQRVGIQMEDRPVFRSGASQSLKRSKTGLRSLREVISAVKAGACRGHQGGGAERVEEGAHVLARPGIVGEDGRMPGPVRAQAVQAGTGVVDHPVVEADVDRIHARRRAPGGIAVAKRSDGLAPSRSRSKVDVSRAN
jgi:hypothetical protein